MSTIEKNTPLLIGLNVRSQFKFGGAWITDLNKGQERVCQYRHLNRTPGRNYYGKNGKQSLCYHRFHQRYR